MGFDADAFVPDGRSITSDPGLSAAFTAAAEWVVGTSGQVDGFLHIGSLDCGLAIGYLSRGLGRACGPDVGIWLPDEVRALAADAHWPDPVAIPADEQWAYWSARRFVETCLEQELGIWFV